MTDRLYDDRQKFSQSVSVCHTVTFEVSALAFFVNQRAFSFARPSTLPLACFAMASGGRKELATCEGCPPLIALNVESGGGLRGFYMSLPCPPPVLWS